MPERVLTTLELNRALLARQSLLERTDKTLPSVVEGMGGIQAQYAPASYVGLWSRMQGFRRSDLDDALTRRTVVQGTLLRATIHLVSTRDYWPWALGIRQARRDWFLRVDRSGLTAREHERSAVVVADALAGRTMSRAEIEALVAPAARSGIGIFVDLVRVPPSGTWAHRRADLFALATDWVGPEPDLAAPEAVEVLVRRYLGAFGPAHRRDIATWAGLPVGRVRPVLEGMGLCRFRSTDGDELVDLPDAVRPEGRIPAPVRLLAQWDALLLVHARRTQVLPEEIRPRVFTTRNPFSVGTVLFDGAVAALWRLREGVVEVEELASLPAAVRAEIRDESERLTAFHR